MSLSRTGSWRPLLAGLAALVTLGGLTAAGPAAAAPPPDTGRTVDYRGYEVTVPAGWRVVDLAAEPGACIRFDRPAVYLGEPGDQSSCPPGLKGRTAGLVVEPIDAGAARQTTAATAVAPRGSATAPAAKSRDGAIQVAVEDAGVLVTAAHGPATEDLVRDVLAGAELTAAAERTELPAAGAPSEGAARPAAAAGPQPGDFRGQGFDACAAPSQTAMDAWLAGSPYRAVGVYISGATRACAQPNLTASWVTNQTNKGWHLIPIDVGRQAPCSSFSNKMSSDPVTARAQGVSAANASVTAAQSLGIPAGSALYSDIEGYTSTASCKAAVMSYVSGWTEGLHAKGYLSGLYSSASSGIRDAASVYDDTRYLRVDHLWFAWWNGVADTDAGSYVPDSYWAGHQRIHQYVGEVYETYGGQRLHIDRNYLDVGKGTPPPVTCTTANLSFNAYGTIRSGSTGALVDAAQCLLEAAGHDPGGATPTGTFDAGTVTATKAFQTARGLTADGVIGPRTWTALLARGTTPTLQNGSTGDAVTRLQRALTAALGRTVGIDGIFGPGTQTAVRDYQSGRGLGVDGIVGPATWGALQAGK
ncbi:glycoside hydrolase domain-containing protein [Streptomyces sp. NPDC004134]|uniref:glycoside hydrolase domain-containing protein n=1 Tax=Streptomyces sp. NPDC004134 TaxID=3364691 RepID=UPI0036CE9AC6